MVNSFKDYSLNTDVKRQLGIVIKNIRVIKSKEYKLIHKEDVIKNNPYLKAQFAEYNRICHYNTLTKLESDFIKEDIIYHQLLNKLDLYFQCESEDHDRLIVYLNILLIRLIQAKEFIDIVQLTKIKNELVSLDLTYNCIAYYHKQLMLMFIELLLFQPIDLSELKTIELLNGVFVEMFEGFALHTFGIYYSRTNELDLSLNYLRNAQSIYQKYQIENGVVVLDIVKILYFKYQYIELKQVIDEIQPYYIKHDNKKQLIILYNYLLDYYLLINHLDYANEYFEKVTTIINKNTELEKYRFISHFHWAIKYLADMDYEQVYNHSKIAYETCETLDYKLQVAVIYLIALTKNGENEDEILNIIHSLEVITTYSNIEQYNRIFKYFQLKYNSPNYYRRYTHEKLIPYLDNNPLLKDYLLFILEDFYKIL